MPATPHQLNAEMLAALSDEGPVVMVNLVRLRERAADGGSAWDAYVRYSRAVSPLLKARRATILWSGNVEGAAFGDIGTGRWDFVVLVRYPSRASFLDMMRSPEYAQANIDREAGVADHLILSAAQAYSKVSPG